MVGRNSHAAENEVSKFSSLSASKTSAANAPFNFTLTDSSLVASDGLNLTLSGIGSTTLIGGDGNDTFDAGGWTKTATLTGGKGTNSLVASRNADMTLTTTSLASPTLGTLTISGITDARLSGGTSNNVFTLSGWNGTGMLTGGGGSDTVVSSRAANFTLSNTQLIALNGTTPLMTMTLAGVGVANLTGGTGNDAFIVSDWSGVGTFNGAGGTTDKIVAVRDVGVTTLATTTLTNATLVSTGLGTLNLTNIETAHLSGGASANQIVANQFTLGSVTLQGNGGDDVLIGGTKNDSLIGGAGRDLLIGGGGADALIGDNTVAGSNGEDILIGGTTSFSGTLAAANLSAINAIMSEWQRTDLAYNARVLNLRNGGGNNGTVTLNSSTVQNDAGAADNLKGSAPAPNNTDLDWFFQSANDVLDAIVGEMKTPI